MKERSLLPLREERLDLFLCCGRFHNAPLFVNLQLPVEDELAPLAAITPKGNGNGNGSYAGSFLS